MTIPNFIILIYSIAQLFFLAIMLYTNINSIVIHMVVLLITLAGRGRTICVQRDITQNSRTLRRKPHQIQVYFNKGYAH